VKVYVIQLLATRSQEGALQSFEAFKEKGLPVRVDKVNGWFKVRIGNFKTYAEAKQKFLELQPGAGYITLIDYDPSVTILPPPVKPQPAVEVNIEGESPLARFMQSAVEEVYGSRNSPGKVHTTALVNSSAKLGNKPTHLKEEEMSVGNLLFWLVALALLAIIIVAAVKSYRGEPSQEEIAETPHPEEPEEGESAQQEKGTIFSSGKLIVGESAVVNGDVVCEGAVVVKDGAVLKGTVKAGKYVKLGKNIKSGSITAPIVHTISKEEVPSVPQTESAVGGIKSDGDLELSDGLLVQGAIEVTGSLKLGKKNKVIGDITAKKLIVEEGTFISGKVNVSEDVELKNGVIIGSGPGKGAVVAGGTVKIGNSVAVFGNIEAKQVVTE